MFVILCNWKCNLVLVELQDMLEHTSDPTARQKQRILLQQKHKEELKHTDMKLVLQLDQKVRLVLIIEIHFFVRWHISSFFFFFYIHGSVHRNSILIRSNKMQQYASIYLLQNPSMYLRRPSHPSSGVRKTVTAASGRGHSIWATTFLQRGQI